MLKVLFVEDEAIMRAAFQKMIDWGASGYSLAAAVSNGAEALRFIADNQVDIVFTDLKMPVMDGLTLIEKLREKNFGGVIVVLSNYTDFDLVRSALTSGASDYMLKINIDGESLLKQLDAAASILNKMGALPAGYENYRKEIRDTLKFIHNHFSEKITLEDIAKVTSFNGSYISRLFKSETGENLFNYINGLRMKKAAEIIKTGGIYMREVAAAVGIEDQFFFARVFKKYHGVSPSKFAKDNNGGGQA